MAREVTFVSEAERFLAYLLLDGPSIIRLQNEEIRELLDMAVAYVPLYRDLYASKGIDIDAITGAAELWRLPSVSRSDYLRAKSEGYVHAERPLSSLRVERAGELRIYSTFEEGRRNLAGLWTGWLSLGVRYEDRLLMLSAPYLQPRPRGFTTEFLPEKTTASEMLARFRALNPTAIIGPVESIARLATEVARERAPERHQVKKIFPFGQGMDDTIRGAFDAGIFHLYGSLESGWIAHECERHDGLHLFPDRVITQVARPGQPDVPAPPGELGELVVTSLLRRTTPFIRYRLGHLAVVDPTPCPCGRLTSRLRSLETRDRSG